MLKIFFWLILVIFIHISSSQSGNVGRLNFVDLDDDDLYNEIDYVLQQHAGKSQRQQTQSQQLQGESPRSGILHPKHVNAWPEKPLNLGQVSGVIVDQQANPVIFHRGSHIFDAASFNGTHHYQHISEGPIKVATILVLNSTNGDVISGLGKNRFYLPHGITIDKDGNIWITDVGLHQVMKFPPGSEEPTLVLGEAFIPGSDNHHFCKPTDIAVATSGEFFISDGYCNSRIQKYNPDGRLVTEWGHSGGRSIFAIPHSMALVEDQDMLCVADRENRRIQCFSAGLNPGMQAGKFIYQISTNPLGRVYAITYGGDGLLFGVAIGNEATGFTVDLDSGDIVDTWSPEQGFDNPHDVSVAPDGSSLYVSEIQPNRITKFNFQ